MDLTLYFKDADELTAFCMLPDTTAQDAALAERIAELSRNGVHIEGMQCSVTHCQQYRSARFAPTFDSLSPRLRLLIHFEKEIYHVPRSHPRIVRRRNYPP